MYPSYLAQYNIGNSNANVNNNPHPSNITNPQVNMIGNPGFGYDSVDEVLNFMLSASQQLRIAFDHLKLQNDAMCDVTVSQIRVQAEIEKQDALLKQRNDFVGVLRSLLPSNDGDIIVQQMLTQLQMENTKTNKVCSNCSRDAYLECTACRTAYYCSIFCQKKDWVQHQNDCTLQQLFDGNDNNNITSSIGVGGAQQNITLSINDNNLNNNNNNNSNSSNGNQPPNSKDISI